MKGLVIVVLTLAVVACGEVVAVSVASIVLVRFALLSLRVVEVSENEGCQDMFLL